MVELSGAPAGLSAIQRFASERLGGLEWPPIVEIDRAVRIYDPDDYERYMRGEFVKSERIMTKAPR